MNSLYDPDEREYRQELQDHNLLQDALQGNNLLGMMIEDKPKFGRQSDSTPHPEIAGANAIDLFVDPLSIFGSERHPALQEVLKQLDKSKKSRGEILELQKQLDYKRCKA